MEERKKRTRKRESTDGRKTEEWDVNFRRQGTRKRDSVRI